MENKRKAGRPLGSTKSDRKIKIQVRITPAMLEELDAIAELTGKNRSTLAREFIAAGIARAG